MRRFLPYLLTLFISMMYLSTSFAQLGPRCSLSELACGFSCAPGTLCPPSVSCCSAPVLCSVSVMDGYSSTTIPFDNPWIPIGWCGTTENIQFLGFVATGPSLVFSLTPYDCQDGNGIQVAVYSTNCDDEWTQLFCQSDGSPNVANVSVTLTPGEIYYIVIDGFAGDFCNFDIDIINSGPDETTLDPATAIFGPGIPNDTLCPGTFNYFTPLIPGAQCYNWSVNPPIATIEFPDTLVTNVVDVTFTLPGTYELCVQPDNFCVAPEDLPDPYCETIIIDPPVRTTDTLEAVCLGESMFFPSLNDDYGPGFYILDPIRLPDGCDSIPQIWIPFKIPSFGNPPDTTVCGPDCITYLDTTWCESGVITRTLEGANFVGCDSTVIRGLCFLNPMVEIAPVTPIGCGSDSCRIIDATATQLIPDCDSTNSTFNIVWTASNGGVISGPNNGPTLRVCTPGTYTMQLTQGANGVSCNDSDFVEVTQELIFPDDPVLDDPTLSVCDGDVVEYCIEQPTAFETAGYLWTVPSDATFVLNADSSCATVTFGVASGDICITALNECGPSNEVCTPIAVFEAPELPVLTGLQTVCAGDTEVYTMTNNTPPTPGLTWTYMWTVPPGATITSGQNTPSITVGYLGASSGDICLTVSNGCDDLETCLPITVLNVPPATTFVNPISAICANSDTTFTINASTGATSYAWTTTGGTVTPSADGLTAVLSFGATPGSVDICVTPSNDCGDAPEVCTTVDVNPAPDGVMANIGDNEFCENSGDQATIGVTFTGTAPFSFTYTIDGGAPITETGIADANYTFNTGTPGDYVITSVDDATGCPGTFSGDAEVIEHPLPTAVLSGSGTICNNTTQTVDLTIDLTGSANWTVGYTLDAVPQADLTVTSSPFTLTATRAGTYALTTVTDDNGCENTATGSVTIDPVTAPTVTFLTDSCNLIGTGYQVLFSIASGDPSTYTVLPAGSGTIGGAPDYIFTSNFIPTATGYSFLIFDANSCDTVEIARPLVVCDCNTEVGVMDLTPIDICGGTLAATATYDDTNQFFDPNDGLQFVLHEGSGPSISNEIARSNTPNFNFTSPPMNFGQTYYISAIVGNAVGGVVDLNDPCLDVAIGTPVTWYDAPGGILSGPTDACLGEPVELSIDFTSGVPPYDITYTANGDTVRVAGINADPYIFTVNPTETTQYVFTEVVNAICPFPGTGDFVVNMNDSPVPTLVTDSCNTINTEFTVIFTIADGDPSSYEVLPAGSGTLSGNTFTSNPLAQGSSYSFQVFDSFGCDTATVSGQVDCPCETMVGTMDLTAIDICGTTDSTSVYDDTNQVFDGNDGLQYILHEGSADAIINEIARNSVPSFGFNPPMVYGQTYYISAVAGDLVGGNVDLTDRCLQVAPGTPITWYETPVANLTGGADVCNGDGATLTVTLTVGSFPYSITYEANGVSETIDNIMTSPFDITVTPTDTTEYVLTGVANASCPGDVSGSATVNVNNPPTPAFIGVQCNATATEYVLTIQLTGGDPSTYFVDSAFINNNGVLGAPITGTLTGNTWVSDPITAPNGYYVTFDDQFGCGPLVVSIPEVTCVCLTEIGTMAPDTLEICGTGPIDASTNYDPTGQNLDGDDAFQYVLYTGADPVSGTVVQRSFDGTFSFQPPMMYNRLYQIAAVAGNELPNGDVFLFDFCLVFDDGLFVRFNEIPTMTLTGDSTICIGETVTMNAEIVGGVAPYTITLNNGTADTVITGIATNSYPIQVTPGANVTYTAVSVEDQFCSNSATGSAAIDVNVAPTVDSVFIQVNSSNTQYEICLEINGGELPYEIGAPYNETVNSNDYCTPLIDCDVNFFSFTVDDMNACGPVLVQDSVVCLCESLTGTMTPETFDICGNDVVSGTYDPTGEFLDGNDALCFFLFDSNGGVINSSSASPAFGFEAGMIYGEQYSIVAVVGDDDGSGCVRLSSLCIDFSDAALVTWYEVPGGTLSGTTEICDGESTNLSIDFTGTSPYNIIYNDGTNSFTETGITDNPYTLAVTPNDTTTYTLDSVYSVSCGVPGMGAATVTVNYSPDTLNIVKTCNATNTFYTVSFEITGGDAATYTVDGNPVGGSTFTSQPIANGGTYSFSVDDSKGCGPVIVAGDNLCPCETEVGVMDVTPLLFCDGEIFDAPGVYDDTNQVFDGDDAQMWVLHTSAGTTLGTVLASNTNGQFGFDPAFMTFNTTYYVSPVVGNEVAGGLVDLNDPCLQVGAGTPIEFKPIPTATLTGTASICEGQSTDLLFNFTGTGTNFTVEYTDGTNTFTEVLQDGATLPVNPAGTTTYTLISVSDSSTPSCTNAENDAVTVTVSETFLTGSAAAPLRICEATETTVNLFDLLNNEDPGGVWTETSGTNSTGGAFNANTGEFEVSLTGPGVFDFTYTHDNSAPCVDQSTSVQITIVGIPDSDAGADGDVTCEFPTTELGGAGTTISADLDYYWVNTGTGDTISTEPTYTTDVGGTFELYVADSQSGCAAVDQVVIDDKKQVPAPDVTVAPVICFGDNNGAIFINGVDNGTPPYFFSLDGAPFSTQSNFLNLQPGVYEVSVLDAAGCESTLTFDVTEPDELSVVLSANLGENNTIELGDEVNINAQVNVPWDSITQITWEPRDIFACDTCINQTFMPTEQTTISISVQDVNGCRAEDLVTILVEKEKLVFVPNAFSPNGDATNGLFSVFAKEGIVEDIRSFLVFDRWGEQVYELYNFDPTTGLGNQPLVGWDGTFRGEPMDPAVFTWFAEIEFIDGEVILFEGDVTLIR